MKKIYALFMLGMFCSAGIQAQNHDYVPLVREGVTWNYCFEYWDTENLLNGQYQQEYIPYSLYFDGDTTINEKVYKRCYCTFEGVDYLVAFMREADKRVYGIRADEGSEAIAQKYGYYSLTEDFSPDYWDGRFYDYGDFDNYPVKHEWADGEMLVYDFNNMEQQGFKLVEVDGTWRYGNNYFIEGFGPIEEYSGDFLHPFPVQTTCLVCQRSLGLLNVVADDGHEEFRSDEYDRLSALIYTPLVREGVRWVYLFSDMQEVGEGKEGTGDFAYFMEFRGDTIINGRTYKKLYAALQRNFDETTMRPVAYMREEHKKVYVVSDPEGRYQYVPERNLELTAGGMALYGPTSNWEEYLLYDFDDITGFTMKVYPGLTNINDDQTIVNVGTKPSRSHYIQEYYFNATEGVGCYRCLLHFGEDELSVPTCVCPIFLGLAQLEDLEGNILFKGPYYYEPYRPTGKEDVSYVDKMIDITLGKTIYSRHYLGHMYDVNADYQVNVTDVSLMIDIILGKYK